MKIASVLCPAKVQTEAIFDRSVRKEPGIFFVRALLCLAALCCALLAARPVTLLAYGTRRVATYPVGFRQLEYRAPDGRRLVLALLYPAVMRGHSPTPFAMPFFKSVHIYKDLELAYDGVKHPLIMFSHGRGSNPLYYAWFTELLAAHGYIVAAPYHYRANTYDATIAYLANKVWQRPVDIKLEVSFLLNDPYLRKFIDASKIGVAGHSQGGFTALWLSGARIDPEKYLAFQRSWRNDPMVQAYLRDALPLDARPALHVRDDRIKAAFAMAPGVFEPFGMDATGLRQLHVPTYIIVGAGDTQTPPESNAAFAARYIRNAQLNVIAGRVDHEIFVNECNAEGRDELPEACIDAPGVDRAKLHKTIGDEGLEFFDASLNVRRKEH